MTEINWRGKGLIEKTCKLCIFLVTTLVHAKFIESANEEGNVEQLRKATMQKKIGSL